MTDEQICNRTLKDRIKTEMYLYKDMIQHAVHEYGSNSV